MLVSRKACYVRHVYATNRRVVDGRTAVHERLTQQSNQLSTFPCLIMLPEGSLQRSILNSAFLDTPAVIHGELGTQVLDIHFLVNPNKGPMIRTRKSGRRWSGMSIDLLSLRKSFDISKKLAMSRDATMYRPLAVGVDATLICAVTTSRTSTVSKLRLGTPKNSLPLRSSSIRNKLPESDPADNGGPRTSPGQTTTRSHRLSSLATSQGSFSASTLE